MIFHPVLPLFLLIALFGAAAAAVVWAGVTSTGAGARVLWGGRLLLVLLCFTALLRPGIPGGTSTTLATDTDIVLVVDTTASIVAEDWNGERPRLDGVRADVAQIVDQYPGARFALITFDAAAQLRLPLTTDTSAVTSAMDVLRPEVTANSRGSSIGIAASLLRQTLTAAAESASDRSRMVFYFGDGEQTVSSDPESFADSASRIDGGAVLGYGTEAGGAMRITSGRLDGTDSGYIEYQGAPAKSVVDAENLARIGSELGVPVEMRSADTTLSLPEAPTTSRDYSEAGVAGSVIELYWIPALGVVLLLGLEIARATMGLVRMRSLTEPRSLRTTDDPRGGAR